MTPTEMYLKARAKADRTRRAKPFPVRSHVENARHYNERLGRVRGHYERALRLYGHNHVLTRMWRIAENAANAAYQSVKGGERR